MASLQEKANNILNDKTSKIVPENIKKDVTIFNVTGTLETLDTSDGTATANDIISRKTAYVNGQKITGTLPVNSATYTFVQGTYTVKASENNNYLGVQGPIKSDIVLQRSANIDMRVNYQDITNAIRLTADKIKSGETVLGVTGTYSGEIKNTIDENTGITNALVPISVGSVEIENIPGVFGKVSYIEPLNASNSTCVIGFVFYTIDDTALNELLGSESYIDKVITISAECEDGVITTLEPSIRFWSGNFRTNTEISVNTSYKHYIGMKVTGIVARL